MLVDTPPKQAHTAFIDPHRTETLQSRILAPLAKTNAPEEPIGINTGHEEQTGAGPKHCIEFTWNLYPS